MILNETLKPQRMKTRFLAISLLSIVFLAFNSCTETKLLTKDIYVTLSSDFVVNETTATTWNDSTLLDAAAQSSDLETYKDAIQTVTLDKVTYQVIAFNGPAGQILNSGFVDVADAAGTDRKNLAQMQNVNIAASMGSEHELPVNADAATKLVGMIKDSPHKAMGYTHGVVSAAPIDMTVKVKYFLTVRVELL